MGHIRINYNLHNNTGTYEVVVGSDRSAVNESFVDNFQDCLRVILEEYFVNIGGENITPSTQRLELIINGNLPERERKIFQRIVDVKMLDTNHTLWCVEHLEHPKVQTNHGL